MSRATSSGGRPRGRGGFGVSWSQPQPICIPATSSGTRSTLSSRDKLTREVLLASLSGKPFEDIKFFAFSRRTSAGQIDQPLPILANSTLICHASPHFNEVLVGGFSEGNLTDIDGPYPSNRPMVASGYHYDCDSDIEDEDDKPEEEPNVTEGENRAVCSSRPGRVVFLEDIAHATWKAFVFYAYFGETNFAQLKSQRGKLETRKPEDPPFCSPKSMYRLADKYNIPALKKLAADDINSKLGPDNIFEELFGTFTSLYPEIQETQIDYLNKHIQDPIIRKKLPQWMEALAEGRLHGGAAGLVSALILSFD